MPRKKNTAPSRSSPQLPDSVKITLTQESNKIIENVLKPTHIKPPPTDNDFNYLVDIYSKWYRHYFYFCAKYNCPSANAIFPSFETKFARLEYVGKERFNLSYLRHTNQWYELYQGLTIVECLQSIAEEPHFIP